MILPFIKIASVIAGRHHLSHILISWYYFLGAMNLDWTVLSGADMSSAP